MGQQAQSRAQSLLHYFGGSDIAYASEDA